MPSPMKFRRPTDRGYSMSKANAENGAADPTKYRGNHFCREDLVRPIKLAFSDKPVHSTTTLRLLSSPYNDPKVLWEPWRFSGLSVKDDALGDWIRTYRAARGVGSPAITYFLYDSAKGSAADNKEKFYTNPYWVLFKRCHDAKKNSVRSAPLDLINLLTTKTDESYSQIPPPADMYIARGLVYERGAKDKDGKEPLIFDPPLGLLPDDPRIPLIDLGPQLGQCVLDSCDELINEEDEEELLGLEEDGNFDWAQFFKVGDPVGLDHGVFWRAFPAKAIDPRETKTNRRRGASLGEARGGRTDKIGYEAYYTTEFNGLSPDVSEHADLLRQRVKSWDEMLLFHEENDQIAKLCSAIRARDPQNKKGPGALVLNLFDWAWGPEYPEFVQAIPEELWDRYRAKASVSKSTIERELEDGEGDEDDEDDEDGGAGGPSGVGPKPGKTPDPIIAQAKKLAERRRAVVAPAPAPEPEDEEEEEEDLEDAEVLAEGEPEEVEPEPEPAPEPAKRRKADAYREKLARARNR